MKINTKQCTPIPTKDSVLCMENTNPFIQVKDETEETKDQEYGVDDDNDNLGRQVTYIPQVIFTPTLTSKRNIGTDIPSKSKFTPKSVPPRLSNDDVQDLTDCLSKMMIVSDDDDDDDDNDVDNNNKTKKAIKNMKTDKTKKKTTKKKAVVTTKGPFSPPLGRYEVDVIAGDDDDKSNKNKSIVRVVRSVRLTTTTTTSL